MVTGMSIMNPLQRCSLHLELDQVLDPAAFLPHCFAGHSSGGQRYLIVQMNGNERTGTWVCAPISERALGCVLTGRAEFRDAIAHTTTGTVDVVTIGADGSCDELWKFCRELDDEELPARGDRVLV
jgi:hypothetical protein